MGQVYNKGDGDGLTQTYRSTGFVRRLRFMGKWVHGTDGAKGNITTLQQKEKKITRNRQTIMRAQAHGDYLSEHFSVNGLDDSLSSFLFSSAI